LPNGLRTSSRQGAPGTLFAGFDPSTPSVLSQLRTSELHSRLEGYHAGTRVAAEADAEESGGRRGGVGERSEARLGGGITGDASQDVTRECKVRVVEDVEELAFEAQLQVLADREIFCDVKVAPGEVGAAEGVASEVSELAGLRVVSASALASGGVDGGDKCVGIEPLESAGLRDSGDGVVCVARYAGKDAGELRSGTLHDAVSVSRIG